MMERLASLELKLEARQKLQGFKNDMLVRGHAASLRTASSRTTTPS